MRCSIGLAAVVVAFAAGQFASAADKPEGSIDLFDGKSLTGWEHYLVKPDGSSSSGGGRPASRPATAAC